MILSAQTLRRIRPVRPFHERTQAFGLSFGVSPAGYDIRIDQDLFLEADGFMLASSMEHFSMPDHILGIVHDKSTWARKGLTVQNTVIEPGWRGFLTLELTNHSKELIQLCRGMPIAQIIFHTLDHGTDDPYNGKYQDQPRGPQEAK